MILNLTLTNIRAKSNLTRFESEFYLGLINSSTKLDYMQTPIELIKEYFDI